MIVTNLQTTSVTKEVAADKLPLYIEEGERFIGALSEDESKALSNITVTEIRQVDMQNTEVFFTKEGIQYRGDVEVNVDDMVQYGVSIYHADGSTYCLYRWDWDCGRGAKNLEHLPRVLIAISEGSTQVA